MPWQCSFAHNRGSLAVQGSKSFCHFIKTVIIVTWAYCCCFLFLLCPISTKVWSGGKRLFVVTMWVKLESCSIPSHWQTCFLLYFCHGTSRYISVEKSTTETENFRLKKIRRFHFHDFVWGWCCAGCLQIRWWLMATQCAVHALLLMSYAPHSVPHMLHYWWRCTQCAIHASLLMTFHSVLYMLRYWWHVPHSVPYTLHCWWRCTQCAIHGKLLVTFHSVPYMFHDWWHVLCSVPYMHHYWWRTTVCRTCFTTDDIYHTVCRTCFTTDDIYHTVCHTH